MPSKGISNHVAPLACLVSFHGMFVIKHKSLEGALGMQLFLLTALLLFPLFVSKVENTQWVSFVYFSCLLLKVGPSVWHTLT